MVVVVVVRCRTCAANQRTVDKPEIDVTHRSTATAASVLTDAPTATPCRYGTQRQIVSPNHHSTQQ